MSTNPKSLQKLILCSVQRGLSIAWRKHFADLSFVEVYDGSILDLKVDAIVSPANSFGFMDGGIDSAYMAYFGEDIQMRVRRQIYDFHDGELLVGQADIVETGNAKIPFLIAAPTMRVPMHLHNSVNPYLAARAVFRLLKNERFTSGPYIGSKISERVQTIAMPGLGTGVGRMNPDYCALQVRKALGHILLGEYKMPRSWAEASEEHQLLYTDTFGKLQW